MMLEFNGFNSPVMAQHCENFSREFQVGSRFMLEFNGSYFLGLSVKRISQRFFRKRF